MSLETLDVKFLNVWKEEAEERRKRRKGGRNEGRWKMCLFTNQESGSQVCACHASLAEFIPLERLRLCVFVAVIIDCFYLMMTHFLTLVE